MQSNKHSQEFYNVFISPFFRGNRIQKSKMEESLTITILPKRRKLYRHCRKEWRGIRKSSKEPSKNLRRSIDDDKDPMNPKDSVADCYITGTY